MWLILFRRPGRVSGLAEAWSHDQEKMANTYSCLGAISTNGVQSSTFAKTRPPSTRLASVKSVFRMMSVVSSELRHMSLLSQGDKRRPTLTSAAQLQPASGSSQ